MGILDSAGSIASVLSAIEAARAKGRVDTAGVNQNQANAAANIYRTQAEVALKGPLQSAKAAAQGDQMANIKPFTWTGGTQMVGNLPVPQFSGGLTPDNFGPATRKAGADLAALSANRVSSPDFNIPSPPVLPPVPDSSGLDSILSTAGGLGSLLGALGKGASGGGGDIKKLIDALRGNKAPTPTNGNTGQRTGDFGDWLDNPDGSGPPPSSGPTGDPKGIVDTKSTFGIPGGYPDNPEESMSADPEWWRQFLAGGGQGGDMPDPGPGYGG